MATTFPPPRLQELATRIKALLSASKKTVSVAETASGGLISATLLSIPGASAFYKGGLTIYTLESRVAFAGWTQTDIDNYGGPSPGLVSGLAENVRGKLKSDYTISESGTAGPTGKSGQLNRTPGYVTIAVASAKGTKARDFDTKSNDRSANMVEFASLALELFIEVLEADQ